MKIEFTPITSREEITNGYEEPYNGNMSESEQPVIIEFGDNTARLILDF